MSRVRRRTSAAFRFKSGFGITPGSANYFDLTPLNSEFIMDEIDPSQTAWGKLRRRHEKGLLSPVAERIYLEAVRSGDTGNGMQSQKVLYHHPILHATGRVDVTPTLSRWFSGDVLPVTVPSSSFLTPSSVSVLNAAGGEAIRRVAPTNPNAGVATAIKEIVTEGLPSIPGMLFWKNKGREALSKTASKEFLNIEFGWSPLLNDIRKAFEAAQKADQIWQQFVKNSGSKVRRKYSFPAVTTTAVTDLGLSYGYPAATTQLYVSQGRLFRTVQTSQEVWFSGAFRYAVPSERNSFAELRRQLQRAHIVFGLDLTPETLWNMAPWSWLVDWIVDLGSVLKTLSLLTNDGLVMQYGYVMEKKTEVTTWNLHGLTFAKGPTVNPSLTMTRECRVRRKATPFGFGLDTASFTERQWAILAALGMSRRP